MKNILLSDSSFEQFVNTTKAFNEYQSKNIPLCAAENVMSPFAKMALLSSAQEKYVMGGVRKYLEDDNFVGGEFVYPYYQIINKQCQHLFGSSYADARTLTGMNSITTLLMSLLKPGDTIAISVPDCGGHASIPDICHRLGLRFVELPYNYLLMDFDYDKINDLIKKTEIHAILLCISDLVNNPKLEKINQNKKIPIIYDATQVLGLIAGGTVVNPFSCFDKNYPFILMGATHKTIPGPSCGLILTQNMELAEYIEEKINPMYIRNTQMHQKMSLILTLLELQYFGKEYSDKTVYNAQRLSQMLQTRGLSLLNAANGYTNTHQLHFTCTPQEMNDFYDNCVYCNVTLNFKTKKLFKYSGIRIGTQEISRYNWSEKELFMLSNLLEILFYHPHIYNQPKELKKANEIIHILSEKKNIHYTFAKDETFNTLETLLKD